MATVMGTLRKSDGTPATGGNTVQYKNQVTGAVYSFPVSSSGQYTGAVPYGRYDIGVNGDYTGNTPASVVIGTPVQVIDISSPHAK